QRQARPQATFQSHPIQPPAWRRPEDQPRLPRRTIARQILADSQRFEVRMGARSEEALCAPCPAGYRSDWRLLLVSGQLRFNGGAGLYWFHPRRLPTAMAHGRFRRWRWRASMRAILPASRSSTGAGRDLAATTAAGSREWPVPNDDLLGT